MLLNILICFWKGRTNKMLPNYRFNVFLKYTEPQKKRHTKKYNSQFSLHLYNEIVYMCTDKILVQR